MPLPPDIASRAERLARIESGYDGTARGQARAEAYGPLTLFVREGPGWPLYARPAPTADRAVTPDDIAAVRARQRELGVPEAFEWVHDVTPEMLDAAEQSGLSVLRAPLLALIADVTACRAVSAVGFRTA